MIIDPVSNEDVDHQVIGIQTRAVTGDAFAHEMRGLAPGQSIR
jgi:hypothetical protein